MPTEAEPQPVLPYASPDVQDVIPFLVPMRRWRSFAGWSFLATVGSLLLLPPAFSAAACAVLLISSIGALVYMTRAAAAEVGAGYALRQLTLAALLLPVFLLGVFVVTRLVESDLINWRLATRPGVES